MCCFAAAVAVIIAPYDDDEDDPPGRIQLPLDVLSPCSCYYSYCINDY